MPTYIPSPFSRAKPLSVAVVALVVSACAGAPPPTEQLAVSSAAINQAVGAGSAEMAPTEMRAARDKLHRANVAMVAKDYEEARLLASEAEVDARLAEAKAQSGKAQKAADEVREGTRVLREELDRKTTPAPK